MNKVEQYIEKQNKIILENRKKTLIALDLTEKEYSPDNRESWQYPKYDYVNGEKRYYKEVAIQVTDEEYTLILSKAKQVEEIEAKEEQERQKERNKTSHSIIKKWIPVFEKPKSEWSSLSEDEKVDNGRSKIASILRVVAWIIGIVAVISGVVIAFGTESIFPVLITFGVGVMEILTFYALAAILDYLSELTSIARNGYKYTETNK
ncbi:MAG: hypothetical protein J6Q94_09240 [Clostridia bacterium]|nr:hypothetical protein [Clostridia bacterium]